MTSPQRTSAGELIVRSNVPPSRPYPEYKAWLRYDFYFSCAYCTMSEAEAQAIRFTIDHYEPKTARPDLENEYGNLMYCCDECNIRKGNRYPPPNARTSGVRFFRPDSDSREEHFKLNGVRLEGLTTTGSFTIDAIDLNRLGLRTLRQIRERLAQSTEQILRGISALKRCPIDRLPLPLRSRAVQYIKQAVSVEQELTKAIEHVLREAARSPLLEQEADEELQQRAQERKARLSEMEALYPGVWRTRKRRKD